MSPTPDSIIPSDTSLPPLWPGSRSPRRPRGSRGGRRLPRATGPGAAGPRRAHATAAGISVHPPTTTPSPFSSTKRVLNRSWGIVWRSLTTTTGTPSWNASAREPGPGLVTSRSAAAMKSATRSVKPTRWSRPGESTSRGASFAWRSGLSPQSAITRKAGEPSRRRVESGSISGEPLPPNSSTTTKPSSIRSSRRTRSCASFRPSGRSAGAGPSPRPARSAPRGFRCAAPARPPAPFPR